MIRELTQFERDALVWLLPDDRQGYSDMLQQLRRMNVVAQGRRGDGHLILGPTDLAPDHDSPLPQVFAHGAIEYDDGTVTVTVREPLGDQVDVEFSGVPGRNERRRWSLSAWDPGAPCPQCGRQVREVHARTQSGAQVVLAACPVDKRLWVHEERSGVSHPMPVTLFYSELMRQIRQRDPKIALESSNLFTQLDTYSDTDLLRAFVAYNEIRTKVGTEDRVHIPERPHGWFARLRARFSRSS